MNRAERLDRRAVLLGGLAGLALPVLGSAARGAARGPALEVWRAQVILVRHAAKQEGEDPELTEAGHVAAFGLAGLLAAGQVSYLEHSPFRRTQQTMAPLAQATGIEPTVTDPHDVDALRIRLHALPDGALAVVAGHSNTIPQAVVALGGEITDLDDRGFIHDEVYDRLFVISLCRVDDGPVVVNTLELRMP